MHGAVLAGTRADRGEGCPTVKGEHRCLARAKARGGLDEERGCFTFPSLSDSVTSLCTGEYSVSPSDTSSRAFLLLDTFLPPSFLPPSGFCRTDKRTDVSLGSRLQRCHQSALPPAAVWLLQDKGPLQVSGAAGSKGLCTSQIVQCRLLRGKGVGMLALQGARRLACRATASQISAGNVACAYRACCSTESAGCTADGTLLLMLQCIDTACRGPQEHRLKSENGMGGGTEGRS